MTRTLLLAAALGLTLASGVSAMNPLPNVPSLWPAAGAFGTPRANQDTVTRSQTGTAPAPAPKPVRQDR
jgi:hypothetical protein